VKSRDVSRYHRAPKYQRRGSDRLLEPWCDCGPPKNCNGVRDLFVRRPLGNYVDVDSSVRNLISAGVTAHRTDSWLNLCPCPTFRRQDGLQFVDQSREAKFGFLFSTYRWAITRNIICNVVDVAIHVRNCRIERVLGFVFVGF